MVVGECREERQAVGHTVQGDSIEREVGEKGARETEGKMGGEVG